jgi:SnoaL-like domain
MNPVAVEDRIALEDLLNAYCAAIDARADADAAAAFFVSDGVLDNSSLGSPIIEGRAAIAATITGMFGSMAGLEHYLSNFLVLEANADSARTQCYVQAHGRPNQGEAFAMRGVYRMDARREAGAWKIARLGFSLPS